MLPENDEQGVGMAKKKSNALGVAALVVYIIGGIATFAGMGMVVFMKGKDLWGWGDGRGIGFLFLFTGLCISVFGVLLMRIFRNRRSA
jgi:hypothetical protein